MKPEGQAGGQVTEVRGDVETCELEGRIGLAGLRKRRAFGCGVKAAAIELESQARRGVDIAFGL